MLWYGFFHILPHFSMKASPRILFLAAGVFAAGMTASLAFAEDSAGSVQTTTTSAQVSTVPTLDTAACSAALEKMTTAMITAVNTRSAAEIAALQARLSATKSALSLTGEKLKTALASVANTYMESLQISAQKFQNDVQASGQGVQAACAGLGRSNTAEDGRQNGERKNPPRPQNQSVEDSEDRQSGVSGSQESQSTSSSSVQSTVSGQGNPALPPRGSMRWRQTPPQGQSPKQGGLGAQRGMLAPVRPLHLR